MSEDDVPQACGIFLIPLDGDSFTIRPFNNLHATLGEDEADRYEELVYGLMHIASEGYEYLTSVGKIVLENERSEEIEFEPEDELIDAIAESKIIPFNRKQ